MSAYLLTKPVKYFPAPPRHQSRHSSPQALRNVLSSVVAESAIYRNRSYLVAAKTVVKTACRCPACRNGKALRLLRARALVAGLLLNSSTQMEYVWETVGKPVLPCDPIFCVLNSLIP